ncbi:DUF6884 domain-containing protein [Polymorphospora sp. NPDC051019]|uniref:DUF6884 domain-containing protein n=1 Tax=Polymorphospora sp. NPDC051019 TaxID=3155725 RepID=UPI00343A23DA
MNRDNRGCRPAHQLDTAAGHVTDIAARVATARTPSEALTALTELEAACRQAREWIAVDLVLVGGWSYADIGRVLGVSRQAACKAYADPVNQRMRRTVRGRDDHIVIVPCGHAKRDHPTAAGDMYTGSYHQACRRAANAIGGQTFILSARHGFLHPATRVEPYDLRMGQPGAVTVPALRAQARALGIDTAGTVTVLAGRDYADPVTAIWPHAHRPLDNARGIGQQMARLAELARTPTAPVVTHTQGAAE